MTSWTPEALAAALAVLTGAACASAVQLARTYSQVVNLVEGLNRGGVPIRGAKGGGAVLRGDSMGRQPRAAAVSQLLPVDPVNQLAGVTVSSAAAPTGPVDCGPACVVSCIEEIKGCWSADELLRLRYFGVVDSRLTTAEDLVGMLRGNGIDAHARYVDFDTMRLEVTRNWQAGRPSIILGAWVTFGYGHWMKYLGEQGGPRFMNPWPTALQQWSWDALAARYSGAYVHVDGSAPSSGSASL